VGIDDASVNNWRREVKFVGDTDGEDGEWREPSVGEV
jgi:hypothetical protein